MKADRYKDNSRSARILDQSREYFNKHAATYELIEPAMCYQPVFDKIKKISGKIRLLDVGCGNGIMLQKTADELENVERLTGVDLSVKMVEESRNRLSAYRRKCVVIEGTMESVRLRKNFYNVVLCMHSFHHYPHPLTTLKNINRTMEKNGIFILADNKRKGWDRWLYNWYLLQQGHPYGDMWIYSKTELKMLAKMAGFAVIEYQNIGEKSFVMVFRKV